MQFGTHLYIILLTATVTTGQELVEDKIYTYDIFFNDASTGLTGAGSTVSLASPGILDGPGRSGISAITYLNSGVLLPSFALPPSNMAEVRLVHTSCRKTHGGHYDALPAVSTMIDTTVNLPKGRPHQLFFTGDQIYADDVSAAMLAMISDVKSTFIGNWSEFGTRPDGSHLFAPTPAVLATEIGNRFEYIKGIQLTTDEESGQNHLLGLGEFMGMYLLNWADTLWPTDRDDLPTFTEIYNPLGITGTEQVETPPVPASPGATLADGTVPLPEVMVQPTKLAKTYLEQTNKIWLTRQALVDVRRALANVPTYMMWDDHEVADDWFFSFDWTQKVLGIAPADPNPYGRLVIQNGMTAFNICQGWGNAPERYTDFTAGNALLKAASKVLASPTAWQVATNWTDIAELVLPHWGADTFGGYDGTALTSPIEYDLVMSFGEYAVLVLDTRSNRFFHNTSAHDATAGRDRPILMRQQRLADVVAATASLQAQYSLRVVVVVSPAPVIGHNVVALGAIEGSQAIFDLPPTLRPEKYRSQAAIRDKLDLWLDSEAWSGNQLGLQEALRQFATFKRVVMLSGDVHFSYSSVVNYWPSISFSYTIAAMGQLTCSAAKNSTETPGLGIETRSNSNITGPLLTAPRQYVGWDAPTKADGTPHQVQGSGVVVIPTPFPTPVYVRPYTYSVRTIPALRSLNPLLTGLHYKLDRHDSPDWRYSYYFCNDPTPASLTGRRQDYLEPTDPNLTHFERLASEHAIYSHNGNQGIVVNSDNIGEVTFRWTGPKSDDLQVQHGIWYALVNSEKEPSPDVPLLLKPYTLHTLDLTLPKVADRPGEYYN